MRVVSVAISTTHGLAANTFQTESAEEAAKFFVGKHRQTVEQDELIEAVIATTVEDDAEFERAVEHGIFNIAPELFIEDYEWEDGQRG